jgi:hypothetical protein
MSAIPLEFLALNFSGRYLECLHKQIDLGLLDQKFWFNNLTVPATAIHFLTVSSYEAVQLLRPASRPRPVP